MIQPAVASRSSLMFGPRIDNSPTKPITRAIVQIGANVQKRPVARPARVANTSRVGKAAAERGSAPKIIVVRLCPIMTGGLELSQS
jgi:hypothetical protein